MTRRLRILALSLGVALLASSQATENDLGSLTLGQVVFGPPLSVSSLSGQVVMVEFWGTK